MANIMRAKAVALKKIVPENSEVAKLESLSFSKLQILIVWYIWMETDTNLVIKEIALVERSIGRSAKLNETGPSRIETQ